MGMNKKQLTVGFILVVLLVVGYYGLKSDKISDENIIDDGVISDSRDSLEIAFGYVQENISEISPVETVLGGTWYVSRFWTIENSDNVMNDSERFYVEYEDGHVMNKILLDVFVDEFSISHEVKAVFEPGESDWVLIEGEDLEVGKDVHLYEKDSGSEQWVKKN
ncbi:hypothetical protein D4R87_00700 [bacterium]|nr:MAG: hypothetical protein D4R87_00700 [bacterium]